VGHTLASIFLFAAETVEKHEKSKTPFYIAGGALAVWAVIVSAIGITQPEFPGTAARTRLVYGISFVLVAVAMSMAVATAG
jgi:hypothetical protein